MKKSITAVFALVCLSAMAQKKSGGLRIGFTLQPNIAWLHPLENGIKSDGSKVGINYGLMVDYEFAENYIFSTGLQVTQMGAKLSYTGNIWSDKKVGYVSADNSSSTNTANYNLSIQYAEIPFAIKLKTNNRGRTDFWGSFGGFLGIPVKARANVETNFAVGGSSSNYKKDNDNVLSAVQPINMGMQIGAGAEFPFGNKNVLVAGLIFNNGFIDVTKNGTWGGDGRINLNNIALKLGVFF